MAIADKLTQLNNVKLAIKQGLQSKLDLNLSSTPFTDYATQINTITNQGAVTKTFTPSASSQSYTIPKGYHNGSGKVTCNAKTLTLQTSGDKDTNQIDITLTKDIPIGLLVWSMNKEGNNNDKQPVTTKQSGTGTLTNLYTKFSTYSSSRGCLCVYKLSGFKKGAVIRITLDGQNATYRYAIIE